MDTIHRCTDKDCTFVGQVTSKSCGCHKTAEQMLTERVQKLESALDRLSRERDCGCVPCRGQCTSRESLLIEAAVMRDIAVEALSETGA